MINEKSAGAIIYNIKNKKFLLLYREAHGNFKASWDFPKGIIEDEDEETTIKREIEEETGIKDIELVLKFREIISFFYKKDNQLVKKDIIFYIVKTKQEDVKISYEHDDYRWLSFEEAIELLKYKNAKEVLTKANKFLKESLKQKSLDEFK